MGLREFLTKYGLIIVAGLMILAFFLPLAYYIRADQERIRTVWWFFYYQIEAGTPTTFFLFESIPFENWPLLDLSIIALMILIFGGAALLIVSSFTRAKPKLTKVFVGIGLTFLILAFVTTVFVSSLAIEAPMPIYIDFQNLDGTQLYPHIGLYLGAVGLVLGGIIIKLTDWEAP